MWLWLAQGQLLSLSPSFQADSFSFSLCQSTPVHFTFSDYCHSSQGQGVRVGLYPLLPLLMAGSTVLHRPFHSLRSPRSYPWLSTMDPDFIMEAWLSLGLPAEASFLLLCYATLRLCVWDQLIVRSGPSICQGWEPWCRNRSKGPHSATMPINNANRVRDGAGGVRREDGCH